MTAQEIALLILGAIIALIGSAIGTIIQHRLSLQRELSQKWWERKADAYTKIIKSLTTAIYASNVYLRSELTTYYQDGPSLSQETRTEITKASKNSEIEIAHAKIEGDLFISKEAARALSTLVEQVDDSKANKARDWSELLELYGKNIEAIKACLEIIRSEAKKDLEK